MKVLSPALRKFFSYARPYRWWIAGATVCGLLKFNIPVVFPWVLKDVIDYVLKTPSPDLGKISASMVFLILLYIFWSVITYYRSYLADRANQRLIFDLRHDLWVHLQKIWLGYYETRQVGSIASRLLGDTAIAQNFVGAAITNSIMDLSSLAVISALIFHMNWRLALVSVAVLPLYVALNRHFRKKILKSSRKAQQKMEEISGNVQEKLGGISIIQSYTLEKVEEQNFFQESRAYLNYRITNTKNNALAGALIGLITSLAPVLVVWYGVVQVIHGRLTIGELTAFYVYLGMFYSPLGRLSDLTILIANSRSAIDRIYEVFTTAPEIEDRPGALKVPHLQGEIRFSNASFGYEPGRPVLKGIDLTIPAGSIIALVGPSGAGKSTFVKLIPRFYDVSEGAVSIDGRDVRDYQLRSLRRQVALVPQEPILFSGTVAENILMGKPGAGEEEMLAAAKSANAHEFIMALPAGYQTEIGEGGIKLSGGQKQRVALARAFLKNAPILILDEATSALDSESENQIREALQRLMQNRTTLIIAHRLSTVQSAHRIVVFENGTIAEAGNHAELLRTPGGLYRRLYEEQFRSFFPEEFRL